MEMIRDKRKHRLNSIERIKSKLDLISEMSKNQDGNVVKG